MVSFPGAVSKEGTKTSFSKSRPEKVLTLLQLEDIDHTHRTISRLTHNRTPHKFWGNWVECCFIVYPNDQWDRLGGQ